MPKSGSVSKRLPKKLYQIVDNVPFWEWFDDLTVHQCCDCGLVHFIQYKYVNKKKVQITMQRTDKMTATSRRRKEFRGLKLPKKEK